MNKKTPLIFLLLFVGAIIFQSSVGQASTSNWWLQHEDFLVYTLDQAMVNDTAGIPVDNTTLYSGMELSFQAEALPDLNTNPSDYINYTIYFGGDANGELIIPGAPWTIDPFAPDGPPAMFIALPIGDAAFWDSIALDFAGSGFVVSADDQFFNLTYTDANISQLSIEFSKATGIMEHYYLSGNIPMGDSGVLTPILLELTLKFSLSPRNTEMAWAYAFPLLDYRINIARNLNGTDGLIIEPPDSPRERGMIWGEGIWYSGQLLSIDFEELSDLSVSVLSDVGYFFSARTDTGMVGFNISITYPHANPEFNDMFFYPIFPVPLNGSEPYDAYLAVARTVSSNYTTFRTDTSFGLAFESERGRISANWSLATGVLTNFYYLENPFEDYPGMELSFTLLSAADLQNFSLNWNDSPGKKYQYRAETINVDGSTELDVSSEEYPNQFIRQGDLLNLTVVEFSTLDFTTESENGGVWEKYTIVGPSLNQELLIEIDRPGHVQLDQGPPMLYFHLIGGNQQFMDWLVATMELAGATMNANSSFIDLSWSYSINGTPVFDLYEAWNATTGLMLTYDLTYYGIPGEQFETTRLVFTFVGELVSGPTPVDQAPATTGISFLDAPVMPIGIGLLLMTIFIFRKRRPRL